MKQWTKQDEANLEAMIARKKAFVAEKRPEVERVANLIISASPWEMVDKMIEHVDAIRDALAPFDSGARSPTDRAS